MLWAKTDNAMIQASPIEALRTLFGHLNIDAIIGILFAITMAWVSAHFYNHKGARYASGKKEHIQSPNSFRFVYRYIQITTLVSTVGTYLTHGKVFLLVHQNLALFYIGLAIAALAMALFVTAKLDLGEHYSPCFDSYVPKDIIQDGLYRYVRHPIYMSNIMLLAGMFISTGSLWIVFNLALLTVYYIRSARIEEVELQKRFPGYRDYISRTNMLFPGLQVWFRNAYKKQVSH